MAVRTEVIKVHGDHPDWSAGQIAAHLGCTSEYVRKTAARNALNLPKSKPFMVTHVRRAEEPPSIVSDMPFQTPHGRAYAVEGEITYREGGTRPTRITLPYLSIQRGKD